jgi:hypothetical protein
VTPAELLTLLQEFYRDVLDLVQARQVHARSVTDYNANNAYQQVLGRQDVHLQWLSDAIVGLGGQVPSPGQSQDDAVTSKSQKEAVQSAAGVRSQREFVERWAPRVEGATNARHRKMLELVLGEMKEHLRALEQAAAGRSDVLGRHPDGKVLRGTVMATRPKN